MVDVEGAYLSLKNAIDDLNRMIDDDKKYEEIIDILRELSNGYNGYMTLELTEERLNNKISNNRKTILIALLVYTAVFGIVDLIAYFGFGNSGMISSSIGAGVASFVIATRGQFKENIESKRLLKRLASIKEFIEGNEKYKDKSLTEIIELITSERISLSDSIEEQKNAISDYKKLLDKKNEDLAENLLLRAGIEAEVELTSSMKILSKTPDKKRR